MIKAISFDFYNTLVRFWPALEEIQQAACRELGLTVTSEGISRGYSDADVYFNRENEDEPLALRSEEQRLEFFGRYEQMILEGAGVAVSNDLAKRIWKMAMTVPKDFMPFEDTIPALQALGAQGYKLGVISNLRRDMGELCNRLGLSEYLDFTISAEDAGSEKPHAPIFQAALEKTAVSPGEALHVGDQYRSDVLGARAVGMHTVLIDRRGWMGEVADCLKISSLAELIPILDEAPQSLTPQNGAVS
ncbi:MAG: hypothetical protein BZY88_16305 [SAR202 cluster bacterium Io17-Chloro-G9]|nr:MAG: hypothetical protein BZY88_16305 [SAR202 cluster bacterium Io17-Chloro-G9]